MVGFPALVAWNHGFKIRTARPRFVLILFIFIYLYIYINIVHSTISISFSLQKIFENFAITSFVREGLGKFPNSHTGVSYQKEKEKAKRLANRLIKSSPKQNSKCVPICRAQNLILFSSPFAITCSMNMHVHIYTVHIIFHFLFNFIFDLLWFKNTIHSNVACIG